MGNAKKGRARKRAAGSTAAAKRGTRNAAAAKEDPVLPKPPLSWHAVLSFFVVLAAAVTFSIYTWDFLRKMFNTRFTWDLLDATDKRLGRATYSESSLYFTFLEEYASAPTVADAIYGVIRDNKTEYPDVINPMSRFNIWQEVIIGQLWRSGLKEYVADPLDLMIESIWVMQCFSFVGMIILAWYLGGANFFSLACGFVAIATYANIAATERLNCFRAVQFPMLRENYSVPFMWYQLVAVCASLRAGARNTLPRTLWTTSNFALFVSSALMLTGWQFAPFLVLLQVGALLATYIGGYVSLKTVANICTVIAAAMLFVGAVLTMGNIMLLTAPALFVIAAVKVAARYVPTQQSRVETSFAAGLLGLVKRLGLVLVLVLVAFVIKFVVMSLLGMQDDAHIMNILKFKLSGFATAYEDFQTLLYVCSGAYQIMKWEDILFLQEMEQLPTRVVCIIAATVLVAIIELRRLSPRQKSLDVALVFAAANGILLAGLLALIQRLSSVGVPFLCILVAQAASPNHFASVAGAITGPASIEAKTEESNDSTAQASLKISSKSRSNPASKKDKSHKATAPTSSRSLLKLAFLGIGLAVGAWCGQNAYNSFNTALETATPKTQSPVTPRISNDMKAARKLTDFVKKSIPANAALGGDAPILSRIRLLTQRPILNHPHAEHKARRIREEQLYQVFNRWSEYEVWKQLRSLKADYFVFSLGPCNLRCTLPNGRRFDMVYLVNATNSLGQPGRGREEVEQFCYWVYTQQKFLTYFEFVHDGMPFWVIKVLTPDEVQAKKAAREQAAP